MRISTHRAIMTEALTIGNRLLAGCGLLVVVRDMNLVLATARPVWREFMASEGLELGAHALRAHERIARRRR